MSAERHNNLLLTILRVFLILVLVIPVAPSLASMISAGVYSAGNVLHCPEKMQSHTAASKHQVISVDAAMKNEMKCKRPCCQDGHCACQYSCQQLSSSANSTFINYLNIVSTNLEDRKSLFPVIEIQFQSTLHLPTLRPPIC